MANDDLNQIKASYSTSKALSQQLVDQLEANKRIAAAVGDELEVARIEAQQQGIKNEPGAVRSTPTIQRDTAAIERENAVRKEGLDIELQTLDVLNAQVATRIRLGSLSQVERIGQLGAAGLADPGPLVLPAGTRFGGSAGQLAGSQVAAQASADAARAEAQAEQEAEAADRARLEAQRQITAQYEAQLAARQRDIETTTRQAGFRAGSEGLPISASQRQAIIAGPAAGTAGAAAIGGPYNQAEQQLRRYNLAQGEYQGLAARGISSTESLSANFTRLGVTEAEASQAMRAHGALTTEWLSALGRGETTLSEFNYQLGATVGKVAGWTAATGLSFAALGAVVEFGKGAIDSSNEVEQLRRTINDLDTTKAAAQLRSLSQDTAVSMKEAGDAVFQFSRTFHNQNDAVAAARLGLGAYQLDNVQLGDSVKATTAIHQQFGVTAQGMSQIYDLLAAGQREYNARISDMIPLLQKSTGAVKNAGGDLTQLIQIGAYATRVTQLGGSQIGTALYRSAATFLNPSTAKGQTDRATLQSLGINTNQGITEIIGDALKRSLTLTGNDRSRLSNAIFGPQYGGRLSAIFNPQAVPTFQQIIGQGGDPRQALTPGQTRGSFNKELDTQLQQIRKQLDQFVYGLQRLGSALADAHVFDIAGLALRGIVASLDEIGKLASIFTQLPGPVKETVTYLTELRLAMLFFSRTRFGASVPGITSVPGFRPSQATLNRGELSRGTRAAIDAVENNIAQNTAQQLSLGARQSVLKERFNALGKQLVGQEAKDASIIEQRIAIDGQINALSAQENELEEERLAQLAARKRLTDQQVKLTATSRRLRGSDEYVNNLAAETGMGTVGAASEDAAAATTKREAAQIGVWSAAKARFTTETVQYRATLAQLTGATEEQAAAIRGTITEETELAASTSLTSAAMVSATAGAATARTAIAGMGERIGGMIAAIDPLLAAIVVLPFAWEYLSAAAKKVSGLLAQSETTLKQPVRSLGDLQAQATALHQQSQKLRDREFQSNLPGPLGSAETTVVGGISSLVGISAPPGSGAQRQGLSDQLKAVADLYAKSASLFQSDANDLATGVNGGRAEIYKVSLRMRQRLGSVLASSGLPANEIKQIYGAFNEMLGNEYVAALTQATQSKPTQLQTFEALPAANIAQQIKAYADAANVFGTQGPDLHNAVLAYAAMVHRIGSSRSETDLQNLASGQSELVNTVKKNVEDWLHAATTATTVGGEQADIGKAQAQMRRGIEAAKSAFDKIFKQDAGNAQQLAADHAAYAQIVAQFADEWQAVIQAQLQLMQSQNALKVSTIEGSSPESDIQRARTTVAGYQQQLSYAKGKGDAKTVSDLQTKLNDEQHTLNKDIRDNAKSIADAQSQLATAQVTGISPEADLQRALLAIQKARQDLQRDEASGAGRAAVITDQANLQQAQDGYRKAQLDYAQSILAAQGQLAVAAITGISPADDLKRAQLAVANASNKLALDQAQGRGRAQILTDQAAVDDAQRQLNQQIQSNAQQTAQDAAALINARAHLDEAQTTNPVKQAEDELRAAIQVLKTIKPSNYKNYTEYQTAVLEQQAAIAKDRQGVTQQYVDTQMQTLQFELHTQQITDQQYIAGLQNLLKVKKLSQQTIQQIRTAIFDATQQGAVDLNVGSIKVPTSYEVRRAISGAVSRAISGSRQTGQYTSAQGGDVNNNQKVNINIVVHKGTDLKGFSDELNSALTGNFGGSAKAAGLI